MKSFTIDRVGVLSLAKVYGILMAAMGGIVGIVYGLILIVAGAAGAMGSEAEVGLIMVVGVVVIVAVPVIYGVIGFVFGALGAWIYNVIAARIGGVELGLSER